jgi:hypothetical protein
MIGAIDPRPATRRARQRARRPQAGETAADNDDMVICSGHVPLWAIWPP